METKIKDLLKSHQLRSTSIRKRVLALFLETKYAIGKSNIEQAVEEIDRITLYRTLRTFEQKGIIHEVIDGSGKMKYAIGSHECNEHLKHNNHAHFHCVECEKTICMQDVHLPELKIPVDFKVESTQVLLSGKCSECA